MYSNVQKFFKGTLLEVFSLFIIGNYTPVMTPLVQMQKKKLVRHVIIAAVASSAVQ